MQTMRTILTTAFALALTAGVALTQPPAPGPAGAKGKAAPTPGMNLWRARRRLNEAELGRLTASWEGPLLKLPLLPLDRGPALVEALVLLLHEADS